MARLSTPRTLFLLPLVRGPCTHPTPHPFLPCCAPMPQPPCLFLPVRSPIIHHQTNSSPQKKEKVRNAALGPFAPWQRGLAQTACLLHTLPTHPATDRDALLEGGAAPPSPSGSKQKLLSLGRRRSRLLLVCVGRGPPWCLVVPALPVQQQQEEEDEEERAPPRPTMGHGSKASSGSIIIHSTHRTHPPTPTRHHHRPHRGERAARPSCPPSLPHPKAKPNKKT